MNKYDGYIVYRKPTVVSHSGEILTRLVVVDNDHEAEDYLKWMFGPKTELTIAPQNAGDVFSSVHEDYMVVDVVVDFWKGPRYRNYLPIKIFNEGKFYNGFFKDIVSKLIEGVIDNGETEIPLFEFYR